MNSTIDEQIKKAEPLLKAGKVEEAFNLLSTAYSEASIFLSANLARVKDVKQANLWLARLAERVAFAADKCGNRKECDKHCNAAIDILERYIFAGDYSLNKQAFSLFVMRDGPEVAAGSVICSKEVDNSAAKALDELDIAENLFNRDDLPAAYQHLQIARELLYTEVVLRKHELHKGILANCNVRMLEIRVFAADPEALQECNDLRRRYEKLIEDGQLQYARFYYFAWFYRIIALTNAGLLREAFDDSVLLRAALKDEISIKRRDDLAPLQAQFESDILANIKPY